MEASSILKTPAQTRTLTIPVTRPKDGPQYLKPEGYIFQGSYYQNGALWLVFKDSNWLLWKLGVWQQNSKQDNINVFLTELFKLPENFLDYEPAI